MNPARRNKIDLDKLTDEEKKHFRMYGKLPPGKDLKLPTGKDLLSHKLKERKYFDSGDYALSKAGKTSGPVGVKHPSPETIPHANAAAVTHNSSPVKESSLVHETEIDEKADTQSADIDTQTTSTSTSDQTTSVAANQTTSTSTSNQTTSVAANQTTSTQTTSTSTSNQTTSVAANPVPTPASTLNSSTTS